MVFIYRRVRARDETDATDLEARLNAHLVTDFTLRMSDHDQSLSDFDRQVNGEVNRDVNPANAYEFRVLHRQDRSLGKTIRVGSWIQAIWRKDSNLIPKYEHPHEVEMIISCEPGLVASIDHFLIEEPYGLVENREVNEAQYSFSTDAKGVWTQRVIEQHSSDTHKPEDWITDRQNVLESYTSLADGLEKITENLEGVMLNVEVAEDLSKYSEKMSDVRLVGSVRGFPDKVMDLSREIVQEIKARGYKIETDQIQFYKSGNGLYLPKGSQQIPSLPKQPNNQ